MKASTLFTMGTLILWMTCTGCNQANFMDTTEQPVSQTKTVEEKPAPPQPKPEPVVTAVEKNEPQAPMLDPKNYNPEEPIPAKLLHEAFYADKEAWLGKVVTVVGYYKGSTHSSATDRTRVDLKTDQLGKSVVGCLFPGKQTAPRSAVQQRAGVILRGTIADPFFGQVILDNASFINRQ